MIRAVFFILVAGNVLAGDEQLLLSNHVVRDWNSSDHPAISERGKKALELGPNAWQHVQSQNFVLHSTNRSIAIGTSQEAEFYLAKVREALGVDRNDAGRKSHIFIFQHEEDWKTFAKNAAIDPWTGGFFDGLDLFYRRKSGLGIHHSSSTLPHEIAHRALYEKFPSGTLPLTLNEGVAEYHARKLAFQYLRPRGYDVRVISKRVPKEHYIPAQELLAMKKYPAGEEKVGAFYDLSERLVFFLMEKHEPSKFADLLKALAGRQEFSLALLKTYAGEYGSVDQFERAFAEYAILETK